MRKILLLTVVLLLTAWAVAQQGSNPQTAPPSSPPNASPGARDAGQAPESPQPSQPSSGESSIEGCLGGSAGNFTLIDKSGVTYQLQLPQGADASKLNDHIGQEVRVTGTMANATGASSDSASRASGSQPQVKVSQMFKIADTCSTNTAPKK